jgi:TP901 family phage tail tape measure protein
MAKVSIEVVGDTISARTELNRLLTTTERLGSVYTAEFAKMEKSTLALQVAQGNLAVSTARYSAGSLGAARATLAYRNQVDALRASQLAAAGKVGSMLTRYVTAPTLLAAAAAVKLGTDFQSHMLLIQTQAGASAEEVAQLSGQVLKLASSGAQQGPVKLADGLYHLESVGLRGAEAMRALAVTSKAAALGMASIEDVATALAGAVTSNIRGTQDYQQAMGTLNATIGAGNMRMSDLIGALGTGVLPAAKNAGLSLTEVGAALAVLTDRGMQADMAGTRLRMTFALMQSPSAKAVKALADMGVDAGTMAATLRKPNGLLQVLQMLHDGMQSVGAVRGSKDILGAFGGGRSGAGILTLIQSLDSAVSSYQGKVAQIQATSGNLAQSEAAQQKTAAAQFHTDLAKMEADLTKLGGEMLPAVTAIADGVTSIGDAFGHLPGPVKTELGTIVALFAVSGPLLLAIVGVKRMIRTIGTEFGMLPVEAAPGIAATGAEVETGIGGAATAAEVQVSALRMSLLGLGAIAIAPIVIPIVMDVEQRIHTAAGDVAGKAGKLAFDALGLIALGGTTGGSLYQDLFGGQKKKPAAGGSSSTPSPDIGFRSANLTPIAGTGKAVPLTAQQKLADALIANPTSIPLLQQQAANDKSVLAWAERMRANGRMDNTKFQTIYKQYMGDLVATEQSITALTTKSTNARVSEANKRVRAAEAAQRAIVAEAKAAIDRAKLTRGNIKDDEVALEHLIAVYRSEAANKILPADKRATAQQDEAAAQVQLAALRDQYTVPLKFQLEEAKAQATNNLAAMLATAKEVKAAAMKAINSGVLSMQGLIAAWNIVGQANQTIGQQNLLGYKAADVIKMTAGLGLSGEARRVAEARYAQALAHNGRIPNGPAAFGVPLAPIQVHSTIILDGAAVAKSTTTHQQRRARRSSAQVRGRHAGHNLALS